MYFVDDHRCISLDKYHRMLLLYMDTGHGRSQCNQRYTTDCFVQKKSNNLFYVHATEMNGYEICSSENIYK